MSLLQLNGVKNYGYYPDNFLHNQPEIDVIRLSFQQPGIPKMINRIVSFFILCLVLCIPLCVATFTLVTDDEVRFLLAVFYVHYVDYWRRLFLGLS